MKLCFSTIGCPDWTWDEIFATAKDLGMNGIEVRGVGEQIYAPNTKPFKEANRETTMNNLARANMTIPCLTSGACFKDGDAAIAEAKDYIDLAEAIGAPYVRVMIENTPQNTSDIDLGYSKEVYCEMLDYAKKSGVMPLVETNGVLADSTAMLKFINSLNRSNAFVLWDIHHPYRYFSESPAKTVSNLDGLIKHTHVKDSAIENGKVVYRMVGYGDVPILDSLRELKARGYDGFVSLEWVKRWMNDLEEPGIVFSHFFYYMKYLITQL